ncbi:hypothetical protein FA13DRAFT_1737043 [Coprinellus micaceus]|uniref:Uncharacterized protein n=1 Tax=Coprinellus micaceus TaxID=71717 RepID=A0A4Y7SYX7_COPMI|nr:hypothetical protein FA13DRAFT_1737043 [Coprinellus micaceus]
MGEHPSCKVFPSEANQVRGLIGWPHRLNEALYLLSAPNAQFESFQNAKNREGTGSR